MAVRLVHAINGASFVIPVEEISRLSDLQAKAAASFPIAEASLILMHTEGWAIDDSSLYIVVREARHFNVTRRPSVTSVTEGVESVPGITPVDIYCYDRDHLDADTDELAEHYANISASVYLKQPPLSPYANGHSQASTLQLPQAHRNVAVTYHESINELLSALHLQRSALSVALANLDRHRAGKQDSVDAFELFASPLLQNYSKVLAECPYATDLVKRIKVHTAFASQRLSPNNNTKDRVLADSLSLDKLRTITQGCEKVYTEMKAKSSELTTLFRGVAIESSELDKEHAQENVDDLADCQRDAQEAYARVFELVALIQNRVHTRSSPISDPPSDRDLREMLQELQFLETDSRERVLYLVARRNANCRHVLVVLQHIAGLQRDLSNVVEIMDSLDEDLKTRCDNFKHLSRLQSLVPAYAATMGEIVRRRVYSQLLLNTSTNFANGVSKLATAENKLRSTYRSQYGGQLPLGIAGLDEASENIEVEMRKAKRQDSGELPVLTKPDLHDLAKTLEDIESDLFSTTDGEHFEVPMTLREARTALRQAISRIENLERDFQQNLLVGEEDDVSSATEEARPSESLEMKALEEANTTLQRELQAERSLRESQEAQMAAEIARHASENLKLLEETLQMKTFAQRIQSALAVNKSPRASFTLEEAPTVIVDLRGDCDRLRDRIRDADNDLLEKTDDVKRLMQEAELLRKDADDQKSQKEAALREIEILKAAAKSTASRHRREVTDLQSEHTNTKTELSQAQEKLQEQIELLRSELETVRSAKAASDEALVQKDADLQIAQNTIQEIQHTLKAAEDRSHQERIEDASLHKRNSILENDLSSAALEIQTIKESTRQVKTQVSDLKLRLQVANSEKKVLSEEVRTLREAAKSALERPAIEMPAISPEVSESLQQVFVKILQALAAWQKAIGVIAETQDRPSPLKLATYENASFNDVINIKKASQALLEDADQLSNLHTSAADSHVKSAKALITRWQKECKVYRSRSKLAADKIAFRNFKEGDLALFLPTRNTSSQVWAAFNAGFPHYFLNASGPLAEQTKTREWLVARITSIKESTADAKDPNSNPYSLSNGVKYWTLDTEAFVPQGPSHLSRSSRRESDQVSSPLRRQVSGSASAAAVESTSPDASTRRQSSLDFAGGNIATPVKDSTKTNTAVDQSVFSIVEPPANQDSIFVDPPPDFKHTEDFPSLTEPSPALKASVKRGTAAANASSSSSTAPAFLPSTNNRSRSRPSVSTTDGDSSKPTTYFSAKRSNSGPLYVRKQANTNATTPAQRPLSPANSEAFTYASVGSLGVPPSQGAPLPIKKQRRQSATSSGKNSIDFPMASSHHSKAASTLSQSFVSSLGRHAGLQLGKDLADEAIPRQSSNLRLQSNSSLDLLRRFSKSVETTTDASVKGTVRGTGPYPGQ